MALLTEPGFTSGKREELADLISMVDAKNTPFTSMAKKGSKPGNTLFRWQADSLPAPRITGTVDGVDVTNYENYTKDGSTTYRVELSNYIQVFRRAVRVSPLSESIAVVAGVKSELANQISKGVQGLKRDMEATMCSGNGAQLDNGTNPYQTRGLYKWTQPAASKDTTLPVPDAFCTPTANRSTATTATFSETVVQNVLTGIYSQTGQYRDYDCLVGTALKRAFTNLVFTTQSTGSTNTESTIRTLNREASEGAYISSIDVFEGDFGKLRLHPSHFLNYSGGAGDVNKGFVIPFDLCEIRYGGNVASVTNLPNNGGGEARLIEAVAGLCVYNPLAFGVFDFAS